MLGGRMKLCRTTSGGAETGSEGAPDAIGASVEEASSIVRQAVGEMRGRGGVLWRGKGGMWWVRAEIRRGRMMRWSDKV